MAHAEQGLTVIPQGFANTVALLGSVSLVIVSTIAFFVWRRISVRNIPRRSPPKVMVVLGSGGHTTEILALVEGLDHRKFSSVVWVIADSDKTSLPKLERERKAARSGLLLVENQNHATIPRSREVGQSWITSMGTTFMASVSAVKLVMVTSPDLILVNGPGTCIPVILGSLILRALHGTGYPRMIFVESFCRVDSLSLSGRLLYSVVDRFIVQWLELTKSRSKTEYLGVIF